MMICSEKNANTRALGKRWKNGEKRIFNVPRGKNIIFGNRRRGQHIIFWANIHPCELVKNVPPCLPAGGEEGAPPPTVHVVHVRTVQ